ncbi:HigA family addiction module antitoxin [Catellicoccus marimammalium]|uniref:HigA protein (Antitoxin to HigB) n=1 Tax=Catellicoccus marimammalium M35/04/3 TaxID=1234409 RepID=K8Z9Z4_9ENTE|nr:HigA family addiction module antitoxin [Catellicoccus marimammalium]EKU27735.1 HigA protein (antitoxin to HigB) [Catellicoccus marimammalium M35/04/3]
MKKVYPAILEVDPVGYGVYFPDVDGAVTQGKDELEALENASDALGIMLASYIENNEELPIATPIHELVKKHDDDIITLVSVELDDYITSYENVVISEVLNQEFMKPYNVSPEELSEKTNIPITIIQNILHNKEKITVDTSIRLGHFFGVPAKYFINLQNDIDVQNFESEYQDEYNKIQQIKA